MNKALNHLLALTALAFSPALLADAYGISCHGCSATAKSQAATRVTSDGKVFVFDQHRATVTTYRVQTERLDLLEPFVWTAAIPVSTDPVLKQRYRDFVEAQEDVVEMGTIHLPPDFPIQSVAGALNDPGLATTAIEDYLANENFWFRMNQTLNLLVSQVTQLNLGVVDLGDIVQELLIEVEFPDGSDISYEMKLSLNTGNSDLRIELGSSANAHGPDGRALPTTPSGMRGRSFEDHNGSINEWLEYARGMGIPVVRGGSGGVGGGTTRMTCSVSGSRIVCKLVLVE